MSLSIDVERLLSWSDHEREKWRAWIAERPARMSITFQGGGRFPTLGSLFDHIFLVERRHLARLEGGTPPDSSGVEADDWGALFEYGELVRADFRGFVSALREPEASERIPFAIASGTFNPSKRGLAVHVLLHEARHLAQVAYAARVAGEEPPGRHDILYLPEPE